MLTGRGSFQVNEDAKGEYYYMYARPNCSFDLMETSKISFEELVKWSDEAYEMDHFEQEPSGTYMEFHYDRYWGKVGTPWKCVWGALPNIS